MTRQNTELAPAHAADPASFSIADVLGLPHDASPEELLDIAVGEYNAAGLRMARAGAALNALRDVCKQFANDFLPMVEARGISQRHAYNAMQLADYLGSLPEADARRMLKVPYTKVLAIANAEPEVVASLLEEGALDGAQPLSVRELQQRLRDALSDAATAQSRAIDAEQRARQVEHSTARLNAESGLPAWLRSLRAHVVAECSGAEERLDHIEGMVCSGLMPQVGDNSSDALLRQNGAGSAWHFLRALQTRVERIQALLADAYGEQAFGDLHPLQRLSAAEVAEAQKLRAVIFDEQGLARALREGTPTPPAPRGRGRPPKNPAAIKGKG